MYSLSNPGRGTFQNVGRHASAVAINAVFVIVLSIGLSACVLPTQQGLKIPEEGTVDQLQEQSTETDSGLIKATIPPERQASEEVVPPYERPAPDIGATVPGPNTAAPGPGMAPPSARTTPPEPGVAPPSLRTTPLRDGTGPPEGRAAAPPKARTIPFEARAASPRERTATPREPQGKHWEDQKVRTAALDLARAIPSVKKIKLCFEMEADEWWVLLYDDVGAAIDIKQYVWDRESDRLEPHLVLKRIPRSQFQRHLNAKRQGRACEVIDPPTR